MTEDQIKHMLQRFLGWQLPGNFLPDAGIGFNPEFNTEFNTEFNVRLPFEAGDKAP